MAKKRGDGPKVVGGGEGRGGADGADEAGQSGDDRNTIMLMFTRP